MSFHVGQKVVCVVPSEGCNCLRKGAQYTCTALGADSIMIGVDCCREHSNEDHWYNYRFIPLTDTKTSTNFTIGADPHSDKWDNRKKSKERVR